MSTNMYYSMVNSPVTTLASSITASDTIIPLLDSSKLPAAPNIATIGTTENAETILYTSKDGNNLTGVTRGFQSSASVWNSGAIVARYYTAYDHNSFVDNITELQNKSADTSQFRTMLKIKSRQSGYNTDINMWSDHLDSLTGINTSLTSANVGVSGSRLALIGGIDSYTSLMLHMNGTQGSASVTDSSLTPKTITNSNATINTTTYKLGGGSLYFNGSAYISTPSDESLSIRNTTTNKCKDFTIDFWAKKATASAVQYTFFGQCNSAGSATTMPLRLTIETTNKLKAVMCQGTTEYNLNSVSSIADTNWHHIALVCDNLILKLFIDGVLDSTLDVSSIIPNISSNPFVIGRNGDYNGWYFSGYIDEFRYSINKARYTSSFVPFSGEYMSNSGSSVAYWNAVASEDVLNYIDIESSHTVNDGTINYSISRDNGTTFTPCTIGTITDISSQPSGTNIVLKADISNNAEIDSVAWGGI